MAYNNYDKLTAVDWNGQHYILTARNEITDSSFAYAYSLDGINWNKRAFNTNVVTHNPYSVKSLGDKFIIAGNMVSSYLNASGDTINKNCLINIVDGSYHVAITTNLDSSNVIYDIERNLEQPNKIIFPQNTVLSIGNTISYSVNQGALWTLSSSSITTFLGGANDAVWNGKIWVGVGRGNGSPTDNTIATSLDGNIWTGRGNYIIANSANGVDWSPKHGMFLAIGDNPSIIAKSFDGIYWSVVNTALFNSGNDIKWNGSKWVAVGANGLGYGTIAYSSDGINWQYSADSFQYNCGRVYWDGTVWIAYGEDNYPVPNNIATSLDGVSWTRSYLPSATQLMMNLPTGLFADLSLNIYPKIPYPIYADFASSNVTKYVHNNSEYGTAFIQPLTIACGSGACALAYSIDGIKWTAINTALFNHCNKTVWNGVLWVVVGQGNYWVATSYDGLEWTGRNSTLMTECYDIAWNGSYFVAVGVNNSVASLATSSDGISWTPISIGSVFGTRIHAVEWSGAVWLAYGSGTNTTAISSSLNASTWTSTPTPNLCIVDCSNLITSYYLDASCSSFQGINIAANAFDGSFNTTPTKWTSNGDNYDTFDGHYTGNTVTNGIAGEWLQVQLNGPRVCKSYYVVLSVADGSSNPQSWSLFGSNDQNTWTTLDTFDYGPNAPYNDWGFPFVCLPLSISSNTSAYSYYRLVLTRNFGYGFDSVCVTELILFDSGANQLDSYIRPIVLKDLILHPTRVLSVDGSRPNIYRITDLSCNFIKQAIVHGGNSLIILC